MDERRQLPPNDKRKGKNNIRKIPNDYQRKNIVRKVPVKKNNKDKEEYPLHNRQKKVNINEENRKKEVPRRKIKREPEKNEQRYEKSLTDRAARQKNQLKEVKSKNSSKDPKKKSRAGAFILFVVVILLLWGSFILIKNKFYKYKSYSLKWTKELKQGSIVGYETFNDYIIKYSKDGVVCLDRSGNEVWIDSYEMKDPIVSVSSSYVAIADRQGTNIYIFGKDGRIGSASTGLPISRISLSDIGVLAVIVEDSSSTAINFFSKEGNVIDITVKNSLTGDGYPTDISLSPDGNNLLVSYQYIQNSMLKGSVVFYNFSNIGKNTPNRIMGGFNEPFEDSLISKVSFSKKLDSYVLASSGVYFFTSQNIVSPKLKSSFPEQSEIKSVAYNKDYIVMIVDNITDQYKYTLKVYSTNGRLVLEKGINYDYERLDIDKDYIFLSDNNSCLVYNIEGKVKFESDLEFPVLKFLKAGMGDGLILLGDSKMNYIDLK